MTDYDSDLLEDLEEKASGYLARLLSEVTKLPLARVDAGSAFEGFGLDSIMAVTMTERMEADLGPLPATLFFEFGTPRELARHLATTRRSEVAALPGEAAASAAAPAPVPPAAAVPPSSTLPHPP
ncbi:acyl carrier protein [Streptomyces griseoluteus]